MMVSSLENLEQILLGKKVRRKKQQEKQEKQEEKIMKNSNHNVIF